MGLDMMRSFFSIGIILTLLILLSGVSDAIEFNSLADQSLHRCEGGVVAQGDTERSVLKKCGDPIKIASRQGHGPIWIYHEDQANFMYYLEFRNRKLQRIVSSPCDVDDPACYDLQ
jgi:hypothetical protein